MASNEWLNGVMQFDHVVRVNQNGTVSEDTPGIYAPELLMGTDGDGQILAAHEADYTEAARRQGWELERGWTGQYGYSGPVMHPSEYIGGALADHILETPGYWVAISVEDDTEEGAGWAVAYQPAGES